MFRFWKTYGLGILMFIAVACGKDSLKSASTIQSITPNGAKVGKWLVTISVGQSVDTESTLALRNLLTDVFSTAKGGLYEHAIDMDDKNDNSIDPSKQNILKQIDLLTQKIKKFKTDNPGVKTMVAFGLTGHGMTSGGKYYYSSSSSSISGTEIVKFIKGLETDETILIVQSCESGSLPNNHFVNNNLIKLTKEIQTLARAQDVVLSVVTPVDENTNSPLLTWENDILKLAFINKAADKNGDDIISYEEWKNYVMKTACQNPEYVGPNGGGAGINPQFYDPKVPGGLPLALTENGVKKYQNHTLVLPNYPATPAVIWPDVAQICANPNNNNNGGNSDDDSNDNNNSDDSDE